jgi:hypothetical protein
MAYTCSFTIYDIYLSCSDSHPLKWHLMSQVIMILCTPDSNSVHKVTENTYTVELTAKES